MSKKPKPGMPDIWGDGGTSNKYHRQDFLMIIATYDAENSVFYKLGFDLKKTEIYVNRD